MSIFNLKNINTSLLYSSICYLILTTVDSIIYIQWINSINNYKWIISAILFPLLSSILLYMPVILYRLKGHLFKENIDLSQKKMFIIALFNSASSLLIPFCIEYINIFVWIIVRKMSILITMIFSYFILEKRYLINHYISIGIILVGIGIGLLSQFKYNNSSNTSSPIAIIGLFVVICLDSFSNIFKEKYLKNNKNINIFWMNSCITFWQLIIGIFTIPLIFIPIKSIYIDPSDFGNYIINSLNCQFIGINNDRDDNCKLSLLFLCIYLIINSINISLIFLVIKHGSSVIYYLVYLLKTPLISLLWYVLLKNNIVSANDTQKFSMNLFDYITLLFLIVGSFIYSLKQEYIKKKSELETLLLSMDNITPIV